MRLITQDLFQQAVVISMGPKGNPNSPDTSNSLCFKAKKHNSGFHGPTGYSYPKVQGVFLVRWGKPTVEDKLKQAFHPGRAVHASCTVRQWAITQSARLSIFIHENILCWQISEAAPGTPGTWARPMVCHNSPRKQNTRATPQNPLAELVFPCWRNLGAKIRHGGW